MVRLACVITMNCVCAGHLLQQPRQPLDVRLVQRRIHFVQNAERARLILEDGHQQRHRGQRFFAARKQQHVLQPLARRRGDDIDARLGDVGLVGQPHLADAAAEQRAEHLPEILVDVLEGLGEPLARLDVDIVDRLLGVADGIEQVLPLRVQEVVALLRFLEFFERLRIHRT